MELRSGSELAGCAKATSRERTQRAQTRERIPNFNIQNPVNVQAPTSKIHTKSISRVRRLSLGFGVFEGSHRENFVQLGGDCLEPFLWLDATRVPGGFGGTPALVTDLVDG